MAAVSEDDLADERIVAADITRHRAEQIRDVPKVAARAGVEIGDLVGGSTWAAPIQDIGILIARTSRSARQDIGARSVTDIVEDVVACPAALVVVALIVVEAVIAALAVERVVARSANQRIRAVAGIAFEVVIAVAADQRVVVALAVDRIVAVAAIEVIVAVSAQDRVVAVLAIDRVVAVVGPAVAADQAIVAAAAIDDVVALLAVDRVVACGGDKGVVAAAEELVLAFAGGRIGRAEIGEGEVGNDVVVDDKHRRPSRIGPVDIDLKVDVRPVLDQLHEAGGERIGAGRVADQRAAQHLVDVDDVVDRAGVEIGNFGEAAAGVPIQGIGIDVPARAAREGLAAAVGDIQEAVAAAAAIEDVVALIIVEGVVTRPAIHRVVAGLAVEIGGPENAAAAVEQIVAGAAIIAVVARTAAQRVVAVVAFEIVVLRRALERIVAGAAHHRVVVVAAVDRVVALVAVKGVAAVKARQAVVSITARNGVVAGIGGNRIPAAGAGEVVVAGRAQEQNAGVGRRERIIARREIVRREAGGIDTVEREDRRPSGSARGAVEVDLQERAAAAVGDRLEVAVEERIVVVIAVRHFVDDVAQVEHVAIAARLRAGRALEVGDFVGRRARRPHHLIGVVACAAGERIEPSAIRDVLEVIVARAAVERIGAGVVDEGVVAVAARQRIVAGPAVYAVIAGAAVDRVVAEFAEELIVAVAALDEVRAASGMDGVVAAMAVDRVAARRAGDAIAVVVVVDDEAFAGRAVAVEVGDGERARRRAVEHQHGLEGIARARTVGIDLQRRAANDRHQRHVAIGEGIVAGREADQPVVDRVAEIDHIPACTRGEIGDVRGDLRVAVIGFQRIGVDARAARKGVGAAVGGIGDIIEEIVAVAARHGIAAAEVIERVVARSAGGDIVAGIGLQIRPDRAGAGVERIVAVAAIEGIGPTAARERIVAVLAEDLIVARSAGDLVVAFLAVEGIVPRAAVDRVVAVVTKDRVVAVARIAFQRIAAIAAVDGIVAILAVDGVAVGRDVVVRGVKGVVPGRAVEDEALSVGREIGAEIVARQVGRMDAVELQRDRPGRTARRSVVIDLEQRVVAAAVVHQLHIARGERIGAGGVAGEIARVEHPAEVDGIAARAGREIGDFRTVGGRSGIGIELIGVIARTARIGVRTGAVSDVLEDVVAAIAGDHIAALARIDGVGARPALDRVAAGIADEIAAPGRTRAVEQIVAVAAIDLVIGAVAGDERVVAVLADEGLAVGTADDRIVAGLAVQVVVAGAAEDRIVAIAAIFGIVAGAAIQRVVVVAADQAIIAAAGIAEQTVGAGAAFQGVVAVAAFESVVAVIAEEVIVAVAALDGVVSTQALDLVIARKPVDRIVEGGTRDVVAGGRSDRVLARIAGIGVEASEIVRRELRSGAAGEDQKGLPRVVRVDGELQDRVRSAVDDLQESVFERIADVAIVHHAIAAEGIVAEIGDERRQIDDVPARAGAKIADGGRGAGEIGVHTMCAGIAVG